MPYFVLEDFLDALLFDDPDLETVFVDELGGTLAAARDDHFRAVVVGEAHATVPLARSKRYSILLYQEYYQNFVPCRPTRPKRAFCEFYPKLGEGDTFSMRTSVLAAMGNTLRLLYFTTFLEGASSKKSY